MHQIDTARLETALDALPHVFRGPGGVAGVVRDGCTIAARAWGHADREAGRPMTTRTRLPICSISKQFTCGVLLATVDDLDSLNPRVAAFLPNFEGSLPSVRQLCDNQSGLRDYWALTVLHGARAEQRFGLEEALPLIARMKTGHFAPGTRYSYCNANFRLVAELIEAATGRAMGDLYQEVILGPAGMSTAGLVMDTRQVAEEVTGYEGNASTGYFSADNRVIWFGDAGISACLEDMLAYEAWIDTTRNDPDGLYNRLSATPRFSDGRAARYGFGLVHETVAGIDTTGHGGALRGFRAYRLHAPEERLSVVVHFNHEADSHVAAISLFKSALGLEEPSPTAISGGWDGQWLCPETGLLARIETGRFGATLRFATDEDILREHDGNLRSEDVTVTSLGADIVMQRKRDNQTTRMAPVGHVTGAQIAGAAEIAGRYGSRELEASMVIEARNGGVYVRFEGMLGSGRMERVHPAAEDLWLVVTRRSVDAPAPGDWTLSIRRDSENRVTGVILGCWLARGIVYSRIDAPN